MRVIVLLGAPGAGKGTAADGVAAATGFGHVATGDMLREAVRQGTAAGREAEAYMNRGELVPDDVIVRLIEARFDRAAPDDAFLFDGFPRTEAQARLLDRALAERGAAVGRVFLLDAPRQVLISRLAGRRICRQCGANYHVVNIPPAREGVCDRCGGELYQRTDDREETVRNRLDVYTRQTETLVEYYRRAGKLARLDSSGDKDRLIREIVERVRALPGGE